MSTFAVVSDPHVTMPNPETGWTMPPIPNEPTMYAESVELLEAAIAEINLLADLDFVLVAGDLTKDSEPYNHDRVRELLGRFRRPVYCVGGNHDQPRSARLRPREYLDPDVVPASSRDIPRLYSDFGFKHTALGAYACDPAPDVHLIGISSAKPDEDRGAVAPEILAWLDDDLSRHRDPAQHTIVMLHHSIIDHVPGESVNPTFSWFHVENSGELKAVLRRHGVRLVLSGHLHMQDIRAEGGIYNVVTASLAGYPHAYRIVTIGDDTAHIRSRRLRSIPSHPDLQDFSRRCTAAAFVNIIAEALVAEPFCYSPERAAATAARLEQWWPAIAEGDAQFAYTEEDLGDAALAAYVNAFSDPPPADNDVVLALHDR